ncbi:MAG: ligase-associated DNA damage response exonuclease [Gammaproteobacteria bacterium]|nr:ligase-associated DNA damage response exonuclease [Gammaproteobacteria bacterium]
MSHPENWLTVTAKGLFCVPGKFYIDPFVPTPLALITHAHSDHARAGNEEIFATEETLEIMKIRYGSEFAANAHAVSYFQTFTINDVSITFLPAGHILGSAQIQMTYSGICVIFSGDYKRQVDPTCLPFFVQPCDVFVTEATFGLPIFSHPPIELEIKKLFQSLNTFPQRCHLIGAYVLGKCQRLIISLRNAGYNKPIYIHGAVRKLCDFYEMNGKALGTLIHVTEENAKTLAGEIVLCPPSALNDRWTRKLPNVLKAYASGWMQNRFRAKQLGIELPLIISDHADWNELLQTIHEVKAPEIWITHGNEEALLYYTVKNGLKAKALSFLHYEDEDD